MYRPYHIPTSPAPNIATFPSRFLVKVKRRSLASFLLKELIRDGESLGVILSRPCTYGVFSGPVGGFAARQHLCMGCLRCTTEYPEIVQVYRNPKHQHLGDSYFSPEHVETIQYEARTGRVPVRGAGYRGSFGGGGWDGMWTDMSEIVRPTRDGIHGREFISTCVDLGFKPSFLNFDENGEPGVIPRVLSLPIPFLFDVPPASLLSTKLAKILVVAASKAETLLVMPIGTVRRFRLEAQNVVPLITPQDAEQVMELPFEPVMIELGGWDKKLYYDIQKRFPNSIICLRQAFGPTEELLQHAASGIHVFHLVTSYHGRGQDGRFVLDLIREAHRAFVNIGRRDEITLVGSGGVIAAEHIPKAIICGLDAVALDTPLVVALQGKFVGECADSQTSWFSLPTALTVDWGVQRVNNLLVSWRDQLLEVLGAMGLREVRRLRGEMGRAMFQQELEREVFAGIDGYVCSSENH